jgi:hypothetical protein
LRSNCRLYSLSLNTEPAKRQLASAPVCLPISAWRKWINLPLPNGGLLTIQTIELAPGRRMNILIPAQYHHITCNRWQVMGNRSNQQGSDWNLSSKPQMDPVPQPFPQPLASVRDHPLPVVDIRSPPLFAGCRPINGRWRTAPNNHKPDSQELISCHGHWPPPQMRMVPRFCYPTTTTILIPALGRRFESRRRH